MRAATKPSSISHLAHRALRVDTPEPVLLCTLIDDADRSKEETDEDDDKAIDGAAWCVSKKMIENLRYPREDRVDVVVGELDNLPLTARLVV